MFEYARYYQLGSQEHWERFEEKASIFAEKKKHSTRLLVPHPLEVSTLILRSRPAVKLKTLCYGQLRKTFQVSKVYQYWYQCSFANFLLAVNAPFLVLLVIVVVLVVAIIIIVVVASIKGCWSKQEQTTYRLTFLRSSCSQWK